MQVDEVDILRAVARSLSLDRKKGAADKTDCEICRKYRYLVVQKFVLAAQKNIGREVIYRHADQKKIGDKGLCSRADAG